MFGTKHKPQTETKRTWRDFPEFVAEVDELIKRREIRDAKKKMLQDSTARIAPRGIDPFAADKAALIEEMAAAQRNGTEWRPNPEHHPMFRQNQYQAAERNLSEQANKVKREHHPVREAIGEEYRDEFRSVVSKVQQALFALQDGIKELRKLRTEILTATGDWTEAFSFPQTGVGGVADACYMPASIGQMDLFRENEFERSVTQQVATFCSTATRYLSETK